MLATLVSDGKASVEPAERGRSVGGGSGGAVGRRRACGPAGRAPRLDDVLSACNVAAAAVLARTRWEDTWRLMDRAVEHHLTGYLAKVVDTVRKQGNRASIAAKAVIEACSWVWISG